MTWNKVRNRRGRRALDFGMVFAEHLRAMTDYDCNIFTLLHAVTLTVTPMEFPDFKQVPRAI